MGLGRMVSVDSGASDYLVILMVYFGAGRGENSAGGLHLDFLAVFWF
jgi:hypothetical protein